MNVNHSPSRRSDRGTVTFGFALVAIGAILLMRNMGMIWFRIGDLWPIALIAVGLEGLLNPKRGTNA